MQYSYTLDPTDPNEYWYNMTMYETDVYNFNINYNPQLKQTLPSAASSHYLCGILQYLQESGPVHGT